MTNFVKLSCNTFNPNPKPEKVIKTKKGLSYKKKPTGELPIMQSLWEERGPYSQITGEWLGDFNVSFMAHILPKGKNKYPHFKLNKENIIIMSLAQHTAWDGMRSKCTGPEWTWVHLLEFTLKLKYKILHPSK